MGILLHLEVPEPVHALPVLHVRSHDVPVLWKVLSHLQSMREVVVVHISLCCLCFIQSIQFLCFRKRSQCTDVQICVCPRVNIAEPCTLGIRSTSAASGRIWSISLPSGRLWSFKIILRTVFFWYWYTASGRTASHSSFSANASSNFFCYDTDIFFSCLFVICEYCYFHLFRSNDLSLILAKSSSGTAQLSYSCFCFPHSATIVSMNAMTFWFTSCAAKIASIISLLLELRLLRLRS